VIAVLSLGLARAASAFVLGGGLADTDCTIAFGGVDATAGASGVVCTDGDPGCDTDGQADGACRFAVAVCARVPAAGCQARDVSALRLDGLDLFPPTLDVDGACGPTREVVVAVGEATGATAIARAGEDLKDVDYLNLCCRSTPAAGDDARCAVAVDLSVAGCRRVPAAASRAFRRAGRLLARAAADGGAPRLIERSRRALERVRAAGQRLARRDPCGNALGLVARHGQDVLLPASP